MNLVSAFRHAVRAVAADHQVLHAYDEKLASGRRGGSLGHDLLYRAGFQMMVGYRLMRLFAESGVPLAPQVISRLVRFVYGADIHYEAQIADGVVIVHGMGMAVSGLARIGRGAILAHNVSIGEGIDPVTRAVGAPTLEERVHVGPGATLLGPITIGAGSKVMAGCVVRSSVPPDSLVEAPEPRVAPRQRRAGQPNPHVGTKPESSS